MKIAGLVLVCLLVASPVLAQDQAGESSRPLFHPQSAGSFLVGFSRSPDPVHIMPGALVGTGSRLIDRKVSVGLGVGALVGLYHKQPGGFALNTNVALAFSANLILGNGDRPQSGKYHSGFVVAYVYASRRVSSAHLSSHGIMIGATVWSK